MTLNTNSKKRDTRQGFTLVEVIVVAVIVLILSAVAIPMYNGYVRGARQDTVNNLAETAAAAANSFWRRTNTTNVADIAGGANGLVAPNTPPLNIYFDPQKHIIHVIERDVSVSEVGKGSDAITILKQFR
ncbi:MAG: prepilin-type N-terminal cleavage/methylation domain-containing protein [Chitinispirillia bacterium]|nr:prepilin-type N-terminal cleavage/methylation domain-containing protein [Chitinispirillia bacterium]